MGPFSEPKIQPLSAEYTHTLQAAEAGAKPHESASKLFLSADGKTRTDAGHTSLINDVKKRETIVLDHLKKEARVLAAPALPAVPPPGQSPLHPPAGAPPPPAAPLSVQDLGKRLLNGHEVHGKQYVFPPVALPKPPAVPKLPALPKAPAMPNLPAAPKPPELPKMPPLPHTVREVWTSTSLHVPMLTRTTGSFGQQISHCKSAIPGEPHPSLFQIPPGYKKL